MPSNLLFVAPHSLVVRNWLASGLADACARELNVTPVFVSHFQDQTFRSPLGAEYRNWTFPLERRGKYEVPASFPRLLYATYVLRIRTYALEVTEGSIQYMDFARRRDAGHVAGTLASRLLPRGTARRRAARRLVDAVNPGNPIAASVLDEVAPIAMIVGSPGFILLDQAMVVEARRRRLPVHCVVNSWDNMTSRGPFIRRPETLMVWNEYMKRQASAIHGYPSSRTFVVGSLQFAQYSEPVAPQEREGLYRRLGLPEGTPYFLFLTGQHVPAYEAEDLGVLLKVLGTSRFRDVRLVVRLHPQVDPRPFHEVADARVVFDCPPRFTDKGDRGFQFGRAEMRGMAALLSESQLVVASWGTTALLEAAIFDRPIVQLRWMDAFPRAERVQVSRVKDFQKYLHLEPFDAAGCRVFSASPADLEETLERAIAGGDDARARRRAAVEQLATPPLHLAPRRVLEILGRELTSSSTALRTPHREAIAVE